MKFLFEVQKWTISADFIFCCIQSPLIASWYDTIIIDSSPEQFTKYLRKTSILYSYETIS